MGFQSDTPTTANALESSLAGGDHIVGSDGS